MQPLPSEMAQQVKALTVQAWPSTIPETHGIGVEPAPKSGSLTLHRNCGMLTHTHITSHTQTHTHTPVTSKIIFKVCSQ